jgi:predicted MFS family arabinose efflux permease
VTAIGLAILVPAFRRLTPPGTLTARRGLAAAVLIRGVLTFSFFQGDAYVPLSLTSVKGVSTTFAGVALTAASLTWTAGAWVQERRVERVGPRPLVGSGFVAVALGVGLMMVTLQAGVPPALGIVAWLVAGFGIGVAYPPLSLTALALADPGREGSATASLQLADVLGTALGTGLGGVIIATGERQDWALRPTLLAVYAMALAMSSLGVVLARRLPRRLDQPVDPAEASTT